MVVAHLCLWAGLTSAIRPHHRAVCCAPPLLPPTFLGGWALGELGALSPALISLSQGRSRAPAPTPELAMARSRELRCLHLDFFPWWQIPLSQVLGWRLVQGVCSKARAALDFHPLPWMWFTETIYFFFPFFLRSGAGRVVSASPAGLRFGPFGAALPCRGAFQARSDSKMLACRLAA